MNIQDKRMQLINGLTSYFNYGSMPFPAYDTNIAAIEDACNHLLADNEKMPPQFHDVMRTLCDHDFQTWQSKGGTWSSAVMVAIYFLNNHKVHEDGTPISRGRRL